MLVDCLVNLVSIVMRAPSVWGLHAGEHDQAKSLFLKESLLATGSITGICDFTYQETRDDFSVAFRDALRRLDREHEFSDKQIRNLAGQVFQYAGVMVNGDIVAYAPKNRIAGPDVGVVHIGHVIGPYEYRKDRSEDYPHQRPVQWLRTVPRKDLPADAQRALWMRPPTIWRITKGAAAFQAYVERSNYPFDPL